MRALLVCCFRLLTLLLLLPLLLPPSPRLSTCLPDRDGLLKMKAAYEANPVMGDPHSVEGEMADNRHKLEKLKSELARFQALLETPDEEVEFEDVRSSLQSNGAEPIQNKAPTPCPFEG